MTTDLLLLVATATLALVNLVLLVILLVRAPATKDPELQTRLIALEQAGERHDRTLRDELALARQESAQSLGAIRQDLVSSLGTQATSLRGSVVELSQLVQGRLGEVASDIATLTTRHEERLGHIATTSELKIGQLRAAIDERLDQVKAAVETLTARNEERLAALAAANEGRLEQLRVTLETRLDHLQRDTTAKLDQMRATVDERLQTTLERRLGESFRQVSDRLEQVHRGLGEMQTLAAGVGDLKKVLTNVKTRGTWGEVQLRSLLEQGLGPDQFAENVATREGSSERVEFVIKLPGRGADAAGVLLPIDAKFPLEDYQRLLEAADAGDAEGYEAAGTALEARVRDSAREIRDKYINPPRTTDFAILFLPTEGLYAEVLRRPALVERLQQEFRVVVAGPTTLWAIITSLQMGFRTLAIERRSSEVWETLARAKADFARLGDVLGAVQKKLHEASNKIDEAQRGTRRIQKTLGGVEALPALAVQPALLPGEASEPED